MRSGVGVLTWFIVDNILQLYITYVNKYPIYLLQLPYTFEYNFDAFSSPFEYEKGNFTHRDTDTNQHKHTHTGTRLWSSSETSDWFLDLQFSAFLFDVFKNVLYSIELTIYCLRETLTRCLASLASVVKCCNLKMIFTQIRVDEEAHRQSK